MAQKAFFNDIAIKIHTYLKFPRFTKVGDDIVCKAGIVITSNIPIRPEETVFTLGDLELAADFKIRRRGREGDGTIQTTECYRYSGRLSVSVPREYYEDFMGKRYVMMNLSYEGVEVRAKLHSKWYYGRHINMILEKVHKIPELDRAAYFLAQKYGLSFTVREISVTDHIGTRLIVALAFLLSKLWLFRRPILLFEKNAERYEESASVAYERLIDRGVKHVYFVLDDGCDYIDQIGEKYRKHIISKYSFFHFLVFFAARTYIGTEQMVHAIGLRPLNKFIRYRLNIAKYNYVFLQHGVMYMVSLDAEQRKKIFSFSKYRVRSRIVVSSPLEKAHFLNEGRCLPEQIYLTGLPKFDRNVGYPDKDRIAIILTWRPWEEAQSKEDVTQTSYYRHVLRIFESIPEELKEHVIILPHPLVAEGLKEIETPINDYLVGDEKYDNILRSVSVLITDYSSISYDAFYRGTNIIFDWSEKDECIAQYGERARLMLTEELAFGDICRDESGLAACVAGRYGQVPDAVYAQRYSRLVSFHDGQNTERLISCLVADGFIPSKKEKIKPPKQPGRIAKKLDKLKKVRDLVQDNLAGYYEAMKEPLDEHAVLLEAAQGKNTNGNMFALLKEIEYNERWSGLQPYFVVTAQTQREAKIKFAQYGFKRVKLLTMASPEYMRVLATAKYLATDNSFPACYVKREGQILLNTWHGTPLKVLGRENIVNSTSIGNVQKNFLSSDYLLFPNEYTRDVFFKDYMLDAFYRGRIIVTDYPRNQVLADMPQADKELIKGYLGLTGKKVYAYMPTWRGTGRTVDTERQRAKTTGILYEMDEYLNDDEVVLVNLHFLVGNRIDYSDFRHIRKFSPLYDTYDILSACDGLITDYSSVFFDFALTGKPVWLYTYDLDYYLRTSGTYFDIFKLPFPFAQNIRELVDRIRSSDGIDGEVYRMFRDAFCSHYVQGVSEKIMELMTTGETTGLQVTPCLPDGGDLLLYEGSISDAKTQKKIMKQIKDREDSGETITVLFNDAITERTGTFLRELPDRVRYLRVLRARFTNRREALAYMLYERFGRKSAALDAVIRRERERLLLPFPEDAEVICEGPRSDTKLVLEGLKKAD